MTRGRAATSRPLAATAPALRPSRPTRGGRSILAFLALAMALQFFVMPRLYRTRFFDAYAHACTAGAAAVLRGARHDVRAVGATLRAPDLAVEVREGCDALEPIALLLLAVAVAPVGWRVRAGGAAAGAAALFAANLLRIAALYWVRLHHPARFELLHVEISQPLFLLLTIVVWAVWARWALRQRAAAPVVRAA